MAAVSRASVMLAANRRRGYVAGMRLPLKSTVAPVMALWLLAGLAAGLAVVPASASAVNPLSSQEARVCRSLSHCLDIAKRHPHDAFDYRVLSAEFARFGTRGRKALVKRIRAGGTEAGYAADLLALSADVSTIAALRNARSGVDRPTARLIDRTIEAVRQRIKVRTPVRVPAPDKAARFVSSCPGAVLPLEARRREMPYFEVDSAAPDAWGAYRPSARHRIALPGATRGRLRSALPVAKGWLAAYPDGLVRYDGRTGAPQLRMTGDVLSLQPRNDGHLSGPVWAFVHGEGLTQVLSVEPDALQLAATLPGRITGLRRGADGSVFASAGKRQSLTLRPDGSVGAGCGAAPVPARVPARP